MMDSVSIEIAGLSIRLQQAEAVLAELREIQETFQARGDVFRADGRNPHLCRAGCSHCCRSGAVFAVSLCEAVQCVYAVANLPPGVRRRARDAAGALLALQASVFAQTDGPADTPGRRDEPAFSARISLLNQSHPACPLLADDLCSVYPDRPMLCRAYGFPVDAYAVQSGDAIVFRSLCVLYEGLELTDYVRARDLKSRLTELSLRLAGGRDWGRFTSLEAITAKLVASQPPPSSV